jgi:acetyl esterase/lipase
MSSDSFVPDTARERIVASLLRLALRAALLPALAPSIPIAGQRRWLALLARFTWAGSGVAIGPAAVSGIAGEWLRPAGSAAAAILYLHGGAYCTGSAATHRALTSRFARAAGLSLFAADYRLAPEHPFPAAVEDALAAYRALAETGPVVLAGDSAGGGLALSVALAAREQKIHPPVALVLFSPWIDLNDIPEAVPNELTTSAAWLRVCARHYLAGRDAPRLTNLAGLPPTLIQAGGEELLLRDATHLHDALERAGVAVTCEIVPRRWHAFQIHAGMLPSADAALTRAGEFIRQLSARPREGGDPEPGKERTGFPLARE